MHLYPDSSPKSPYMELPRLVFNEPKRAHVTPLFVSLHWLPVAARIQFKTLMLAYRNTTGSAPPTSTHYYESTSPPEAPPTSTHYYESTSPQKPRLLLLTITNLHPLQKPRLLPLTITNLHPPRSPAYFHSLLRIYIPSRSLRRSQVPHRPRLTQGHVRGLTHAFCRSRLTQGRRLQLTQACCRSRLIQGHVRGLTHAFCRSRLTQGRRPQLTQGRRPQLTQACCRSRLIQGHVRGLTHAFCRSRLTQGRRPQLTQACRRSRLIQGRRPWLIQARHPRENQGRCPWLTQCHRRPRPYSRPPPSAALLKAMSEASLTPSAVRGSFMAAVRGSFKPAIRGKNQGRCPRLTQGRRPPPLVQARRRLRPSTLPAGVKSSPLADAHVPLGILVAYEGMRGGILGGGLVLPCFTPVLPEFLFMVIFLFLFS